MLKKLILLFFVSAEISIALCCYGEREFFLNLPNILYDAALEAEKSIQEQIQEKVADGRNMLVALGVTGSGVSTFSSVMLDYRPKKNSRGRAIPDPNIKPPFPFDGEKDSLTSCPSIKKIPGTNKFICDTPGFLHSSRESVIRNEMMRNAIFKNFSYINGLIVVFSEYVLENKCHDFMCDLFGFIGSLIPFEYLLKSVVFVFNKKIRLYPIDIKKIFKNNYDEAVSLYKELLSDLKTAHDTEKNLLISQVEMYERYIQVLQLIMCSDFECLVEFDPFDGGESRKKVLELASKLEPIPTSKIDLVVSSGYNLFISTYREELVNQVLAMKDYLKASVESPKAIRFESQKIIKLFEYLNFDSEEHPNLTKDIIRLSKEVESKKNKNKSSGDV